MLSASSNKLRMAPGGPGLGEDGMPLVETGGGGSGSVCRTTSCVEDPQGSAMEALKSNNLRLLSDLLSEEGDQVKVDKMYPGQGYRTLLHVAVDMAKPRALSILLAGGATPDHFNSTLKLTPLHVAASKADLESLSLLVRAVNSPAKLDIRDRAGRTPLHLAVLAKGEQGLACIRVLVDAGAALDLQDSKGGQTPLYLAGARASFEAVKLLLEQGADHGIPCQGQSTRQLILDNFSPQQVQQLDLTAREDCKTMDKEQIKRGLFTMVDTAQLEGEKQILRWNQLVVQAQTNDLNQDNGKHNLVQLCSERGLPAYLNSLLQAGADPNKSTLYRPASPLLLAATGGQAEILNVLAKHNVDFTVVERETGQTVLHTVVRKPLLQLELSRNGAEPAYKDCLEILLDTKVTGGQVVGVVNRQDLLGNTALHYATQFWDQETVTKLLLMGANIGLRNKMGEAPISNILPSTMEEYLNIHCLKSEGNPTNEDFKVTFHYDFLAPPRDTTSIVYKDAEEVKDDPQPETDVLWTMARSKEHRYLLKHPVITSFLALKWSRISGQYNSNLFFFGLLVACLTVYIFINYAGSSLGVSHPFCIDKSNSTMLDISPDGQPMPFGNSPVLWWIVAALLGLLVIRELLQFGISPSQYLASMENLLEMMLIILTSLLLFFDHPGCQLKFKREIASAVILFSWIEMVTMIGRHPMLASYNIYSTMFYRVLKTFLSFLAWYSLFIIAFGLGFYVLLHEDIATNVDKEYPFFDHIGLCLVKTFSMFVGELEFSDIPFNSPFSYIFFLTFVFLIVVVLMNLLNGLAVSDTGKIREEAEIHAHVCRVEVISQSEATLLGDPAHLLRGKGWLARLVPTCGLRRRLGSVLRIRSCFRRITGGRGVLLFYSQLPNKCLVLHPNKMTRLCSPCFSDKEIGRDITKSAKDLVLKLHEDCKSKNLESAVDLIRTKQEHLDKKMDDVLRNLEKLTKSLLN